MSHCPYGTQMMKGMLPVARLLEDKADITLFKYPDDIIKEIKCNPPDVIGLSNNGVENAVANLGTSLTERQILVLNQFFSFFLCLAQLHL